MNCIITYLKNIFKYKIKPPIYNNGKRESLSLFETINETKFNLYKKNMNLPEEWEIILTNPIVKNDQYIYYIFFYNKVTKAKQWEKPKPKPKYKSNNNII